MSLINAQNTPILHNFLTNKSQLDDHTPIEKIGETPSHFNLFQRIARSVLKSIGAPLPKQLQYNDQESELRKKVVLLTSELRNLTGKLRSSNHELRNTVLANEQALAHLKQDLKFSEGPLDKKQKSLAEQQKKLRKLLEKPHLHQGTIQITEKKIEALETQIQDPDKYKQEIEDEISKVRKKIKENLQEVDSNCHEWQAVSEDIEKLQAGLKKTKLAHSSAMRQLRYEYSETGYHIEVPSQDLRHHPFNKYRAITGKVRHLYYQQQHQPMQTNKIDNENARLHYQKSLEKLAEDFPHTLGGRNAAWFLKEQSHFFPKDSSS